MDINPVLTGPRIPEVSYERVGWSTWLGCPTGIFHARLFLRLWLPQGSYSEQETL